MKKTIYLISIVLMLISFGFFMYPLVNKNYHCNKEKNSILLDSNKVEELQQQYSNITEKMSSVDSIRNYQMSTGKINNEIILGFRLGMSKQEYTEHFNKCKKEGSIKTNNLIPIQKRTIDINTIAYSLVTSEQRYDVYNILGYLFRFEPTFFEDSLQSLKLELVNETYFSDTILVSLFTEKYGDYTIAYKNILGEHTYFIDGNREIEISKYYIVYRDLISSKRKSSRERELQQLKEKQKAEQELKIRNKNINDI